MAPSQYATIWDDAAQVRRYLAPLIEQLPELFPLKLTPAIGSRVIYQNQRKCQGFDCVNCERTMEFTPCVRAL